jgi:SCY1-like protein 2
VISNGATDILPIILLAIESPTHSIVDASLRSLPVILPVLDFSTIKNDLFPVIASVFSKTSSLGIKVRGLEAFVVLCGGSPDAIASNDGLDGIMNSSKKSSSTALDKYTMQEKIIPLIKGIKTKEPAVAIAALNVLRHVGAVADEEFVAMDILPILWSMSLGPLLDLKQFQSFMDLIKSLSSRVEGEHAKKLSELAGINGSKTKGDDDFMSFGAPNAFGSNTDGGEIDFESLVKGNAASGAQVTNPMDAWDAAPAKATSQPAQNISTKQQTVAFSWSTPSPVAPTGPAPSRMSGSALGGQIPQPTSRTITPDLSRFDTLTPASTQFSQPLQPTQPQQSTYSSAPLQPQGNYGAQPQVRPNYNISSLPPPPQSQTTQNFQNPPSSTNWGAAAPNPWATNNAPSSNASLAGLGQSISAMSMGQQRPGTNSFSLPPPPATTGNSAFPPPPSAFGAPAQARAPTQQKSGLDAYESLI